MLWLEVVKVDLDRTGIADIDNIQDLILMNTGKEELTVAKWARVCDLIAGLHKRHHI